MSNACVCPKCRAVFEGIHECFCIPTGNLPPQEVAFYCTGCAERDAEIARLSDVVDRLTDWQKAQYKEMGAKEVLYLVCKNMHLYAHEDQVEEFVEGHLKAWRRTHHKAWHRVFVAESTK